MMIRRPKMLKGYWPIVAIVLSFFILDWTYLRILRSGLTYQIQNQVNHYLIPIVLITGFAWSQTISSKLGAPRETSVLKIVAPFKYKQKKEEKIGFKVISTHDLGNPRIDVLDVYEELLILQKTQPDAILIQKLTPPPIPARYRKRQLDW